MSRSNTGKLRELRAKTDRELVSMIRDRLRWGLALAQETATDEARACAERLHSEARAWLPLVTTENRGELERMVAELGQRLNGYEVRVHAACR